MIIFNIIILLFLLFLNIFFSYELLVNIEDYLEVHNHLKKSIGLPVIGCYFNNRLQVNYVARSEKKNQAYARSFSSSSIVAQSEKNINTDIDNNNDDIIENKFNIVNIVNSNNINSNNNNNNVPNKNVHNNNLPKGGFKSYELICLFKNIVFSYNPILDIISVNKDYLLENIKLYLNTLDEKKIYTVLFVGKS